MRMRFRFLVLLSGLRIRCWCELWCRSQTQLRFHVAVAVVGWQLQLWFNPSLGISICPKKMTKKNQNNTSQPPPPKKTQLTQGHSVFEERACVKGRNGKSIFFFTCKNLKRLYGHLLVNKSDPLAGNTAFTDVKHHIHVRHTTLCKGSWMKMVNPWSLSFRSCTEEKNNVGRLGRDC